MSDMTGIKELIDKYDMKFISGNSVPINCTRLSKEDWEEIKKTLGAADKELVK